MQTPSFLSPDALLAVLLWVGAACVFFPLSLHAAVIPVSTTSYGVVADSECSLAEAILAANTNTAANGCPAGDDSAVDTIVLAADATYRLTEIYEFDEPEGPFEPPTVGTGLPGISSTVTISGNGATIERSGSQTLRVMRVRCGGNLTLQDVTLRYGYAGGIKSEGILSVIDSQIMSNQGGGISISICEGGSVFRAGSLTIENSRIADNEGGGVNISYSVNAAISNSEITANRGGGIFNSFGNTLTVTSSTVSANLGELGGALYNWGSATIVNSSLVSNTASRGGAVFNSGTLVISSTDLVANLALETGGVLYQSSDAFEPSTFLILNSHILNNRAGQGGSVLQMTGNFGTMHENCIVGNAPIAVNHAGGPRFDATKNWWGSPTGPGGSGPGDGDSVSDYVIFADYKTSAIPGCPSRQPVRATYLPQITFNMVGRIITVDTATDFDVDNSDGNCTLAEAILAANTNTSQDQCPAGSAGHDLIMLAAHVTYGLVGSYADYSGLTALPSITSTITILGNGATIERSGSEPFRLLHVAPYVAPYGGNLTLQDVTLRNGSEVRGGGIYNRGILTLDHAQILSSTASLNGGGIFNGSKINVDGTVGSLGKLITLNGTQIAFNRAEKGGGIYSVDLGELWLTDTEIVSNHAVDGGGIYASDSPVILSRMYIASNSADEFGGGMMNRSPLTIYDSALIANTAGQAGGGLYQSMGIYPLFNANIVHIYHSRLLENEAPAGGSALQLSGATGFALVNQNCLVGNSTIAVAHEQYFSPIVTYNWWGAPDGPSGAWAGSGDRVGAGVIFAPYLTEAILGCPSSTSTD